MYGDVLHSCSSTDILEGEFIRRWRFVSRLKVLTTTYMTFWSFIIGVATAAYLDLINWVIDFFWKDVPAWLNIPNNWRPLAVCLPFSIIIGLSQKFVGAYPLTIAQVLDEVKITGHFDYHRWKQILYSGLLILGAGASVGPEASASGLVAGMIYWLGSHYKLIQAQREELATTTFGHQLRVIWLTRLSPHQVDQPITDFFRSKRAKQVFYLTYTLVAFVGLIVFFKFFPQEGVIGFHHPKVNWEWGGLLVVIPALVVGWLFGFTFVKISKVCERWIDRGKHTITKAVLGGLLLVAAAVFSSDCLYSGEFSIIPFAHQSLQMTPLFLVSFAIIKAAITNVGFALGWRGGTIFPAIFSTLAIGACLAHFLPWMPQLTASLVVATGITVILERPLLTAVILWLLLPIQFAVFILVICLLTNRVVKRIPILKP